jgi:hypothetical protein
MAYQVDVPAPMPDPNLIIAQIVPIFGMLTTIVVVGMLSLGPIGKAIGGVLRQWLGGGGEAAATPAALEDLREEVHQLRGQLAELAERQDFSERLLSQVRKERALPAGGQGGEVDA